MNITHSQLDHIRESIHQFVTTVVSDGNGGNRTAAGAFKRLTALGRYALPFAQEPEALGLGSTHYMINQIEREILSQTHI